jgi:hypothetical protein
MVIRLSIELEKPDWHIYDFKKISAVKWKFWKICMYIFIRIIIYAKAVNYLYLNVLLEI